MLNPFKQKELKNAEVAFPTQRINESNTRIANTEKRIHSADIQVGVSCATLICEIAGSVVTKIVFSKTGEIPKDA